MEQIRIADIIVGSRYRKNFGDIEELANSLSKHKQIQPIVLDSNNNLVAGERRLRAATSLGWDTIGFVRREDLDEIAAKEIEIDENLQRKAFDWPEEVLALEEVYNLKQAKYGRRIQGVTGSGGFGIKDAAEQFDMSVGSVHFDLKLAQAIREYPDIALEKTKQGAFKRWKRWKERSIREEMAKRNTVRDDLFEKIFNQPEEIKKVDGPTIDQPRAQVRQAKYKGYGLLYNGDSRMVTRYWAPHSVDLIITDPPYALGLFKEGDITSGKRLAEHEGALYDDDPFKVMDMLSQVFAECNRLLKPKGHAYIFFHSTWYKEMYDMLSRAFDNQNNQDSYVDLTPIIWIKNSSGIGDPNERWVYAYEPCFFINKGRALNKPQPFNYLKFDTVPPQQKCHPTEKPTALLRHLIEASSVEGEIVADLFAGSGSTLVAAIQARRKFMGIELDPTYYLRISDRLALTIGELDKDGVEREMTDESGAIEQTPAASA